MQFLACEQYHFSNFKNSSNYSKSEHQPDGYARLRLVRLPFNAEGFGGAGTPTEEYSGAIKTIKSYYDHYGAHNTQVNDSERNQNSL